jgi:hypothetical protein
MADSNNKNPNEKQPGEKPEGTYHFNPGNQSGKGQVRREGSGKTNDNNAIENREKPPQR